MSFTRLFDLAPAVATKRIILLGPRQTGKTTLLKQVLPDSRVYNLLHTDVFFRLQNQPSRLREEIMALPESQRRLPIIIDEIQKLPILLDEVQALIDEGGYRFVLTGSSARKLKSGGANLLGGRARIRQFFPFVSAEIPDFRLERALQWGMLPPVYLSTEPYDDLQSYAGTYLREEIQAEALVRKLDGFSRFLTVAGICSGAELNFESLARDCGVPARTVREYVAILEDTLVASCLPSWKSGTKRKPVASAKLYFFDLGVARTLAGRPVPQAGSEEWGRAMEHLVYQELRAWLAYRNDPRTLSYWRTVDQREADFVVGNDLAIEVKASARIGEADLKGLREIAFEGSWVDRILVCSEPVARITVDGIRILPIADFLTELWAGMPV